MPKLSDLARSMQLPAIVNGQRCWSCDQPAVDYGIEMDGNLGKWQAFPACGQHKGVRGMLVEGPLPIPS